MINALGGMNKFGIMDEPASEVREPSSHGWTRVKRVGHGPVSRLDAGRQTLQRTPHGHHEHYTVTLTFFWSFLIKSLTIYCLDHLNLLKFDNLILVATMTRRTHHLLQLTRWVTFRL